jgi:hypothetical protein
LIAKSELFDREWYLKKYSDVIEAGIDPAVHYLSDGAAEKRDPGPRFCPESYLQRYSDVAASEMNPLLHYLLHGTKEGPDISPVAAYLKSYPDVAAFYS